MKLFTVGSFALAIGFTTAAPIPQMDSGGTYLGCFADRPERAVSPDFAWLDGDVIKKCRQSAIDKGDTIFALQAGTACFTGKEDGDQYKKYGVGLNACGACGDGSGRMCGAGWTNSVYRVAVSSPLDFPGATYLGCYGDGPTRAIPNNFDSPTDVVINCLQSAIRNKDTIFGVQAGGQCFTGNKDARYRKYGPSAGCNWTCGDGRVGGCGGAWANSVYQVDQAHFDNVLEVSIVHKAEQDLGELARNQMQN